MEISLSPLVLSNTTNRYLLFKFYKDLFYLKITNYLSKLQPLQQQVFYIL